MGTGHRECSDCGRTLDPGARFCGMCGSRQATALRAAQAPPVDGARKSMHLPELLTGDYLMPWRDTLELVVELCRCVARAHERGHDQLSLEPGSFFLTPTADGAWNAQMLDEDVADVRRDVPQDTDVVRQIPRWLQLPAGDYHAPERLVGKPLAREGEVYTLAVIAYELMTGRIPFAHATNPVELLTLILKHPPPRASAAAPDAKIPHGVDQLLVHALQKDPRERLPTTALLANECARLLAGEPVANGPLLRRNWTPRTYAPFASRSKA